MVSFILTQRMDKNIKMLMRNQKNVIFLLFILTKSCCLNDLAGQGQFLPHHTYLAQGTL